LMYGVDFLNYKLYHYNIIIASEPTGESLLSSGASDGIICLSRAVTALIIVGL